MSIDGGTFRDLMGQFATGCTVVTVPGEEQHGMTANAFSSVSLDPPLCLICVDHGTKLYDLLSGDVSAFCINFLRYEQLDLAEHFAGMEQLEESPFEARSLREAPSGAPVFEESLGYADCEVSAVHPAGDHDIFVGEVTDGAVLDEDGEPLLFFQGQWGRLS